MNMREAVEFLAEAAKKSNAEQFDILAGESSGRSVSVFNGTLQNTDVSDSSCLGIRVFKDNKPGYASTELFSKESLEQTLKNALSHCEFTAPLEIELPKNKAPENFLQNYNNDLENLSIETMFNFCLDIEKILLSEQEIENVPHLGAEINGGSTVFANSNGVFFEDKRNSFGIGAGATAQRNGIIKMGYYSKSGRDFSIANAEQIAKTTASRAIELLSPEKIASGNYPVVLSDRISNHLLSLYFSCFYAEQAQKGLSKLNGCLGETIASECFSLKNEPLNPDLPGSEIIDGEGVITAPFFAVENGVFKSFLYNLESAAKEKRSSTGSGVNGFSGLIHTGFQNAVVPLGKLSEKELLSAFPKCLHIVHLEGASGCNAVSGEISIGAQGFLYENGNNIHCVDNITISANFFDLLKNITATGNEYNDSFSNIKIPALAIKEMAISA